MAAVHTRIVCRRSDYASDRRLKAPHGCMLFSRARHLRCTLLMANVAGFGFLHPVRPKGPLPFYDAVEP